MISTLDLKWAAGFMEGEGSFLWVGGGAETNYRERARVVAYQNQAWPLEEMRRIFGGKIYRSSTRTDNKTWVIDGRMAVQIMMTLYAAMSPRRQEQIRKALAQWRKRPPEPKYRTHCPRGHALTEDNVIHMRTGRMCRICKLMSDRVSKQLRKGV